MEKELLLFNESKLLTHLYLKAKINYVSLTFYIFLNNLNLRDNLRFTHYAMFIGFEGKGA